MRTVFRTLGCAAGVLLGLLTASSAHGQTTRSGVHRMEINNGSSQTVRYYGTRLSPGESAALRDLERSENEMSFLRNLQYLKQNYISDERRLEALRSQAQQEFYSRYLARGGFGGVGSFAGLDGSVLAAYNLSSGLALPSNSGFSDYSSSNFGFNSGSGFTPGLNGTLLTGYGAGYPSLPGSGALAASLGYGFGLSDPIKDSLASVIAQQATPQYAALVERNLERAVAQVGSSPVMRVALGLPDPARRSEGYIRPAAVETEPSEPVVVTLKDGTVLRGSKLQETKEWVIVLSSKGRRTRVRPTEVVRIDEGKSAIGPAVDD